MNQKSFSLLAALFFLFSAVNAQDTLDRKPGFKFTEVKNNKATSVKNQYRSGTCWSFAAVSFLESELIRLGEGETDLSEMFFVNHAYRQKAQRYLRLHGSSNFGPGGQAHDVLNIIRTHGYVTETHYPGLLPGEENHVHGELNNALKGFLDAVKTNSDGKLSKAWPQAFGSILDSYMGPLPSASSEKTGKKGLNPDDYIEITSYTHHPFFTRINLEIPDNWSQDLYLNVSLDDLIATMTYALENGFTICWDGDVSDKGFSHAKGVAILPEYRPESMEGTERARWEKMSERERTAELYKFEGPAAERQITQEIRQDEFDNLKATDDHLMHITGIATDQEGKRYFITKNSWGDKGNPYQGYLYMSEPYIMLNTVAITLHKDGIPASLRRKAGIK